MRYYLLLLFALLSLNANATVWSGTIVDADSRQPIQGATITNTNSNVVVYTNEMGHFDIEGKPNDKVTFYCPGYRTETHVIIPGLNGIRLNFAMRLSSRELNEIVVRQKYKTKYQVDSAERRAEVSRTLARHKSSIGSPVSFIAERLSRRQRNIFQFQKEFAANEEQVFTDSRYSKELVMAMTNLSGDTLAYFMNNYKMPYDYARTATPLELKMWIRYNYKDFMMKTDSLRQLKLPY